MAKQKVLDTIPLVILVCSMFSSLQCFAISNCESENNAYKNSVKVCQDLEKAANAASVTLAITSATLNPIAIGAAFTAAASAAKAAEHNCKIRDKKEESLVGCIKLLNETIRQSIQNVASSYTLTEKQMELTKLWQTANLQYQDRLFRFLQQTNEAKQMQVLLSEEWLRLDKEKLNTALDQIKKDHRSLKDRIKVYESENKTGAVVKFSWN